jgi:hypothetical protein
MTKRIFGHYLKTTIKRKLGKKGSCIFGCVNPTFRNESHSLSNFFGSNIISLDECDECNKSFGGTIDNDIANYFNPFIAIKYGNIKYQDHRIRIETDSFWEGSTRMIKNNLTIKRENLIIDKINKTIKVPIQRPKTSSIELIRAMSKYAVSLFPRDELAYISNTIRWIKNPDENQIPLDNHTFIWVVRNKKIKRDFALLFELDEPEVLVIFISAKGLFFQSTVPNGKFLEKKIIGPLFKSLNIQTRKEVLPFTLIRSPEIIKEGTYYLTLRKNDTRTLI